MGYVVKHFGIDAESVRMLKESPESDFDEVELPGGRKRRKRIGYHEDNFSSAQKIVNSSNFFKSLSSSKNSRGFIVEKISAMSKEFLVQEAEKLSNRFGICDNFDVDRTALKDWVKSYHKIGVLRGSTRKYNVASSIFKQTYDELMQESDCKEVLS